MIFHRIGNTYFLYQVWVADSAVGREFTRSKTEIRMAMNGTKIVPLPQLSDIDAREFALLE